MIAASSWSSRRVGRSSGRSAAVLFDLDGVIVDSREHHVAAWELFAREHAPHAPAGYFTRMFGRRNDAIIGGLIVGLDPAQLQQLAAIKEQHFRTAARGKLVTLPGVHELLDFLDQSGVQKGVVTSTPRENLHMILDDLGLRGRFETLVAEEDATKGKPDPEGFLVAAAALEAAPSRCVVIEDAPAGLAAAKAAGMRAIGVTTTHGDDALGIADIIVDSLADDAVRTFIAG